MELTKKDEFVELKFTGKANGNVFDTNDTEVLKELDPKSSPRKLIIIIGAGMVVHGLDKDLEHKELHKHYTVHIAQKDAFGPRQKDLIRTIPLRMFTEQKVMPVAGMTLALDGTLVRISAVSGSRVIADFNNPLAGKDLTYDYTIVRHVTDLKERAETFFAHFLKFVPEMTFGEQVTVKAQKPLEPLILAFKERFDKLVGKPLAFEEVEKPAAKTPSQ